MEKVLSVAAGGAAGALARYGTVLLFQRYTASTFPFAIFTANVLGSFAFGFLWSLMEDRGWVSENLRLLALTGFMGSFTTFSTFAFDSSMFWRSGSWGLLAANIILSNAAALAAIFLGFRAAKIW